MQLVDTHCHIHAADPKFSGEENTKLRWVNGGVTDPDLLIESAKQQSVTKLLCVGTTLEDSEAAINFANNYPNVWATIGLHPHEAKHYVGNKTSITRFKNLATKPKVVAVGETGLDYFYEHSPKADQEKLLRLQIELAIEHNLPLIFHIRDAFSAFWSIFDSYHNHETKLRGVVHSFSATNAELDQALARGLYIGLNGIMTFTKDTSQLAAAKAVPLDRLLLETDAPYLTPVPFRGRIGEPKYIRVIAEFLAALRGENLMEVAKATTKNAQTLFGLGI